MNENSVSSAQSLTPLTANPTLVGAAATMAGSMDVGWYTRYLDALTLLHFEMANPRSSSALIATAFESPTSKSFNAVGIKSVKPEASSNRLIITFRTPTDTEPNHTDEVRSHILSTPLGAYQGEWLKRNQPVLGGGSTVLMRVYLNVEQPKPKLNVRVLTGVQIYG